MRLGLIGANGKQGKRFLMPVNGGGRVTTTWDRERESLETFIERCDAVIVASPTEHHVSHVEACLGAGKHVLCEKPIATQFASVQTMVSSAASAGVKLMGCHTHVHAADIQIAWKRVLDYCDPDWAPHVAAMRERASITPMLLQLERFLGDYQEDLLSIYSYLGNDGV